MGLEPKKVLLRQLLALTSELHVHISSHLEDDHLYDIASRNRWMHDKKKLICSLSFIFWNYSSFFTTAMITFTETYILHSSLIIWKFLYILSIIMKLMLTKKYMYKLQSQTWRLLGHTLFNKPVKFTSVKTNERKTADKLGVFVVVTSVGPSVRVRITEEKELPLQIPLQMVRFSSLLRNRL